jgi:hypothetical protein
MRRLGAESPHGEPGLQSYAFRLHVVALGCTPALDFQLVPFLLAITKSCLSQGGLPQATALYIPWISCAPNLTDQLRAVAAGVEHLFKHIKIFS